MRRRGLKLPDWAIKGAVLAVGLAWAAWLARPLPPLRALTLTKPSPHSATRPAPSHSVDQSILATRDLQQALFDVPSVVAAEASTKVVRPNLELVGTVLDRDERYALLRVGAGQVQLLALGDSIEGYRLTAVSRGSVHLQSSSDAFDLRVPWFDQLARGTDE